MLKTLYLGQQEAETSARFAFHKGIRGFELMISDVYRLTWSEYISVLLSLRGTDHFRTALEELKVILDVCQEEIQKGNILVEATLRSALAVLEDALRGDMAWNDLFGSPIREV